MSATSTKPLDGVAYGLTFHVNDGHAMLLHRCDCSFFKRTRRTRHLSGIEAAAWMRDEPMRIAWCCVLKEDRWNA